MNIKNALIRKKLFSCLVFLSFMIAVFSIQAQTETQENQIGLDEILTSLRASKTGLETTNRILIQKLKKNGLNFLLNEEAEKKLKESGAGDNLILEIKYQNSQSYFDEAKKCKDVDYDCRIDLYNKTISLLPNEYIGYYNRGVVYSDKEDFDSAIQDYTKALELNPKAADAYYNRGVAFKNKEDFGKAIADFNQYLKLKPKDTEAYFLRAATHQLKGDLEPALNDYNRAIQLNPNYIIAFNGRGNIYFARACYELFRVVRYISVNEPRTISE